MKEIAKLIVACEVAGIPYTFDGRKLQTDAVVIIADAEGRILSATKKNNRGRLPAIEAMK